MTAQYDRRHIPAILAVARNPEVPRVNDYALHAAKDDGFIRFVGWPSGHWKLTAAGREELDEYGLYPA